MKKLKEMYTQNSIVQLLISYILVLLFPLLTLSYGFNSAFQAVRQDAYESYKAMLEHSAGIIDNELEKLQRLALQITQDDNVREYARYDKDTADYIMAAIRTKENVYSLMHFQSIEMVDAHYLYFRGKDMILYESSYYQPYIFEKYLLEDGIAVDDWKSQVIPAWRRKPGYERLGKKVLYVQPFSDSLSGDNQGVLVFSLKNSVLSRLLDFRGFCEKNDYLIQIYDQNGNSLWADGQLNISSLSDRRELSEFGSNEYLEEDDMGIFCTVSQKTGWKYVLVVPRKAALHRLLLLKNLVFLLVGAAASIGIAASLYLAIKRGRPINQALAVLASSGTYPAVNSLGEAVTGIIKNHEELLEELEKEKPLLQKAFFHDLVKGEFSSDEQLRISARKVGIELNHTSYLLSSFELFAGNDFYMVDEQTLDEIHIISQLLENRLSELYDGDIWFYKKDYRTVITIFSVNNSPSEIKKVIGDIRNWLLTEYKVETNWGIGNVCTDLLVMWKAAEESMTALQYCDHSSPIVEYRKELENVEEFYFPDVARDKLLEGALSSHMDEVKNILTILEEENCEVRKLKRSQFIKLNQKVIDLIHYLFKEEETGKDYVVWLTMWLNEVVVEQEISGKEYFRRFTRICENACAQNVEKKNREKCALIDEIKSYINTHYMDSGLGLAQIGTIFRVSEGYLSAIFKEYAGVKFTDYLEGLRMRKALELLRDDATTVNDVAQEVGYNSVQSFRRAFKRATGISPKEARTRE